MTKWDEYIGARREGHVIRAVDALISVRAFFKEGGAEIYNDDDYSTQEALDKDGEKVDPGSKEAVRWNLFGALEKFRAPSIVYLWNPDLVSLLAKRMVAEAILLHNFPTGAAASDLQDVIVGFCDSHRTGYGSMINLLNTAIEENAPANYTDPAKVDAAAEEAQSAVYGPFDWKSKP